MFGAGSRLCFAALLAGSTAIVCNIAVQSQPVLPVSQKQALVALYGTTNGSGWAPLCAWIDLASDPCMDGWVGVHCTVIDENYTYSPACLVG
jgi:hypothetical protein